MFFGSVFSILLTLTVLLYFADVTSFSEFYSVRFNKLTPSSTLLNKFFVCTDALKLAELTTLPEFEFEFDFKS